MPAKAVGRRPARLPPLDGSLRDKDDAEAYFKAHNIRGVMQDLTEAIFLNRPEQPLPYLRDKIIELKALATTRSGAMTETPWRHDVREHLQPKDISAAWQWAKKAAEEMVAIHLEALRHDEEAVV